MKMSHGPAVLPFTRGRHGTTTRQLEARFRRLGFVPGARCTNAAPSSTPICASGASACAASGG